MSVVEARSSPSRARSRRSSTRSASTMISINRSIARHGPTNNRSHGRRGRCRYSSMVSWINSMVNHGFLLQSSTRLDAATAVACWIETARGDLPEAFAAGISAVHASDRRPNALFAWAAHTCYGEALIEYLLRIFVELTGRHGFRRSRSALFDEAADAAGPALAADLMRSRLFDRYVRRYRRCRWCVRLAPRRFADYSPRVSEWEGVARCRRSVPSAEYAKHGQPENAWSSWRFIHSAGRNAHARTRHHRSQGAFIGSSTGVCAGVRRITAQLLRAGGRARSINGGVRRR